MKVTVVFKRIFVWGMFILTITCSSVLRAEEQTFPSELIISSGNLKIQLSKKCKYTIDSLKYRGVQLKGYGASGTVFNITGIGFIGTGHTEKEHEKVISLQVFSDGKPVTLKGESKQTVNGKTIKIEKRSEIRDFRFTNVIIVKSDTLKESSTIDCSKDTSLYILYNFMYSWTNKMNNYIIEDASGKVSKSKFLNDNKFPVRKKLKWVGLFSDELNIGLITKILKCLPDTNDKVLLWDRSTNNKFYLSSFSQQIFKAGLQGRYEAVTRFYENDGGEWSKHMQQMADSLK